MEDHRPGPRILIADDDVNVHQSLNTYFRREGYQTLSAYNGEEALDCATRVNPDMIILDIMMPKIDGLTVCREIRKTSTVPIIMLTAKDEEFDKLFGLELGADDYITKPFSPREVLTRVKTILRRMREYSEGDAKKPVLSIGNLLVDINAFTVKLNDELISCTPKEIDILAMFLSNPGIVFSREHLLESIWGYDFMGDTRAVDSHIKRIRAKLCRPGNPWDIRTVWGVGYRLETIEP